MEVGQKVRIKHDGRVGSISDIDGEMLTVLLPVEKLHEVKNTTIADLEEKKVKQAGVEEEWIEGPDVHGRFWDQDGNQVITDPDGNRVEL
jgi:hypothetical protein